MLTPQERALRARLAAQTRWAKEDPKPTVERARAAFESRWEDKVDPDRTLPAAERARRAQSARKAYFTALALKSAKARRRRVIA